MQCNSVSAICIQICQGSKRLLLGGNAARGEALQRPHCLIVQTGLLPKLLSLQGKRMKIQRSALTDRAAAERLISITDLCNSRRRCRSPATAGGWFESRIVRSLLLLLLFWCAHVR